MALTGAFTSATQNEQPLALFREAAGQLFDAPSDADFTKQVDHQRSVQVMMDSTGATAENILGARRGGSGVAVAIQAQVKAEETAKKKNDDARLIAMLADIDAEIAENERIMGVLEDTIRQLSSGEIDVETAMEREEVIDAIREWEERTGRKFDPANEDAADILTIIMQEEHDRIEIDTALRRNERDNIKALAEVDPDAAIARIEQDLKISESEVLGYVAGTNDYRDISAERENNIDNSFDEALSENNSLEFDGKLDSSQQKYRADFSLSAGLNSDLDIAAPTTALSLSLGKT